MSETDLTIGLVAHHAFCPRRAWLEASGERTDTSQVAVGAADHSAVDDPSTSRPMRVRSVDVASKQLGVHGRCDTVEFGDDGSLVVVEHKAAPVRRRSEPTEPKQIQLALQAICLREASYEVGAAAVWFSTTRKRVAVPLTDELLEAARREVVAARRTLGRGAPPPPLVDDPRCSRCSHVSVCLPDEHQHRSPTRRIGVADPLGKVLHLSTPGAKARMSRRQVVVHAPDDDPATVPIGQIAALVVHGNVDVSSALLREILFRGFPIVWCSSSGRVIGWATPAAGPNGDVRGCQYRLPEDTSLAMAGTVIDAKIRNQRKMMRRHKLDGRDEMLKLAKQALHVQSTGELFGVEGRAAALYFSVIGQAIRPQWMRLARRSGHPAKDPANAALDLVYGLLLADVLRATISCGLDPSGGFLHSPSRNKPALALDLMEEFRPIVADSAVLWAANNGEVNERSFRTDLGGVTRLTEGGRKQLIAAYERRVQTEFRHPRFGYKVTWRRAMEIQARMYMAVITGGRDRYDPIVLR